MINWWPNPDLICKHWPAVLLKTQISPCKDLYERLIAFRFDIYQLKVRFRKAIPWNTGILGQGFEGN